MSYAVGKHFDRFIHELVQSGRYNNASEVVREGLRLVEEREARLKTLKQHMDAAIERGGDHSDENIAKILAADPTE
jgi:antitoxin ParD1/3/4